MTASATRHNLPAAGFARLLVLPLGDPLETPHWNLRKQHPIRHAD